MVVYKRVSDAEELNQILKLQQLNLPARLSLEERKKEGFVTVDHTFDILERMNNVCRHIIAKDGHKVVGYALCMHPDFADEIAVLKPMFDQISQTLPKGTSYIVMGQTCVDKDYRNKGVFRKLYDAMKKAVQPEFSCIITKVDVKNTRSLSAHYAVGFVDLKTYSSGGQKWNLVLLK
ncbi:MAG: GNAT family N-acetyltransferase [Aurantibacter sp.]